MRQKFIVFTFIFCLFFAFEIGYSQKKRSVSTRFRTIKVITKPKATVWIDGVMRGETDEGGSLVIRPVMNGTRRLRVRADGFKEVNKRILPSQKGILKIALAKTTSQAELAFQEAEKTLKEDKQEAIKLYKKAIRLRPNYPVAYISLARTLSGEEALKVIATARKFKRIFPEASAVEGRVYKSMGEYDKAINSFDRAIREGRGFQPEAHTGLALLFKDEAENARTEGDADDEKYFYGESAKAFEKAIAQLSATEPVVYLFLGKIYEDLGDTKKAVAVYQKFLRDMPGHEETSAVESFIYQLNNPSAIQ